jgi:predicted glycosyltransferase
MTTESAVLGTPSIFVSTATLGYMEELEHKYGLISNFSGDRRQINAMNAAISILENYDQELWDERRETMLDDKIDTTDFMVDRITQTLT